MKVTETQRSLRFTRRFVSEHFRKCDNTECIVCKIYCDVIGIKKTEFINTFTEAKDV